MDREAPGKTVGTGKQKKDAKPVPDDTASWIKTDEGIEAFTRAREMYHELEKLVGKEKTKKVVKTILDNASPFDHTFRRFDDPKMDADTMRKICERIQSIINDERGKLSERTTEEIDQQTMALDSQPD